MNTICNTCGLPKELCVCETIAKESQKIIVSVERRKFGKEYTIIEGIDSKDINMKELLKKLKNSLACGGTMKKRRIELQGRHINQIRKALEEAGFAPHTIEIK